MVFCFALIAVLDMPLTELEASLAQWGSSIGKKVTLERLAVKGDESSLHFRMASFLKFGMEQSGQGCTQIPCRAHANVFVR